MAGGVVGLALPAVPVLNPSLGPAAVAASTYHCSGYDPCKRAGYSDGGYGAVSGKMYWRMYSGHNCTNYVAYRMIKAGMSSTRPWSSSGMARNWGLAMSRITDKTPNVGAVAWWAAGDGVGSSGHVAVVEKVLSPSQIVISEDSWSGTFHWRTITKSSSSWPTGFIHFVDKKSAPKKSFANAAPPTIAGTPRVGVPLQAAPGSWTPGGASYTYQWLAEGTPIAGATGATYTPTQAQNGATLRVQVTASLAGYTPSSAISAPTGKVAGAGGAGGASGAVRSLGAPTVAGVGQVGEVLTATSAGWAPQPKTAAFRWRANGKLIPRQSGRTLTLTPDLVGSRITVTEVARTKGLAKGEAPPSAPVGPITSTSAAEPAPAPPAPAEPAPPAPPVAPAAPVVEQITTPQSFSASGRARLGSSLQVAPGTVSPADTAVRYEWLRDGKVIPGAVAATYQLTGRDVGHRVVARVWLTRPGSADVARTFALGKVSTTSELAVRAKSKRRAVALGIHLDAPGMAKVDGPIRVRIGRTEVKGRLENGFARVLVPHLKPGQRKVVVTYDGTRTVQGSRAVTRVRVVR